MDPVQDVAFFYAPQRRDQIVRRPVAGEPVDRDVLGHPLQKIHHELDVFLLGEGVYSLGVQSRKSRILQNVEQVELDAEGMEV